MPKIKNVENILPTELQVGILRRCKARHKQVT